MRPEAPPSAHSTASDPEADLQKPLAVTEIVYFTRTHTSYSRCPRCRNTLEREYMSFCYRCGQRLDWTNFDRAIVKSLY